MGVEIKMEGAHLVTARNYTEADKKAQGLRLHCNYTQDLNIFACL